MTWSLDEEKLNGSALDVDVKPKLPILHLLDPNESLLEYLSFDPNLHPILEIT
jgi:hypothetical protein